ncbi:MAG TPA: hypothetical protein PLB55_16315 [Prosthecobacter sp.]|nr:hypothetical protein [Prosthecobacter sp.]
MKVILLALTFLILPAQATSLGLLIVKMPIYLHGSDADTQIQILDVPVMNASDSNEAIYGAICHSFIPPNTSSRSTAPDINIASQYGIGVSFEDAQVKDIFHVTITIDASSAKKPEGYPFTIEQVTDAVMTCVKMMTPTVPEDERKTTIKVLPAKK